MDLIGVILISLATGVLPAEPMAAAGGQVARSMERQVQTTVALDYLLFLPGDYERDEGREWPLILFLHGAGERGDDINLVAVHGPPKIVGQKEDFPFVVASPQCPKGEVWDPGRVLALLDELLESYRIDPERVYLTGLSMGGFGTWETGVAAPERFAALVPICGGGRAIDVFLSGGARRARLKEMPIWAFHGEKDEVVPPGQSMEMVEAFRAIGNREARLTIYEQAGHDSWTETYNDPALYDWMLEQHSGRASARGIR